MGDERERDRSLDPFPAHPLQALLELSLAAGLDGNGAGADLADRTDARAGCREGRQLPDAEGAAPGSEERVAKIAPSRREALHENTGWGAVSVADSGSPPQQQPRHGELTDCPARLWCPEPGGRISHGDSDARRLDPGYG